MCNFLSDFENVLEECHQIFEIHYHSLLTFLFLIMPYETCVQNDYRTMFVYNTVKLVMSLMTVITSQWLHIT